MKTPPKITVEQRRRKKHKIEVIRRQGERAMAEIEYGTPDPSLLRDRRVLLGMIFLLVVLGVFLIGKTNKATAERANYPMTRALKEIDILAIALGRYHFHTGEWPAATNGLAALAFHPGTPNWNGPYINRPSKDPWGTAYIYTPPKAESTNCPTLYSCGPDKTPGTADDIYPSSPEKFDPGTAWTNGWRSYADRYYQYYDKRPAPSR